MEDWKWTVRFLKTFVVFKSIGVDRRLENGGLMLAVNRTDDYYCFLRRVDANDVASNQNRLS